LEKLIRSLEKNKYGMLIMVASAFFTSFGQYYWKISHGSSILLLFIGFAFYGMGALSMILAFKFGSFSVLHPMLSLSYIFALVIGFLFLNEVFGMYEIIGLIFILFGVVMIGVGDE
jgi:drug/metabolite transporter (DMT)-like permease